MASNGQPAQLAVPMIDLSGVTLAIGHDLNNPNAKVLMIGPVTFIMPIEQDVANKIAQGLTGIHIAGPNDLHGM